MEFGLRSVYWSVGVLVLFFIAEGFAYTVKRDSDWWLNPAFGEPAYYPRFFWSTSKSVYDYAEKDLCRNPKGYQKFFQRLKKKLCTLNDTFIYSFLGDLCRHRSDMLTRWVAELFDMNGDRLIDYHEEMY